MLFWPSSTRRPLTPKRWSQGAPLSWSSLSNQSPREWYFFFSTFVIFLSHSLSFHFFSFFIFFFFSFFFFSSSSFSASLLTFSLFHSLSLSSFFLFFFSQDFSKIPFAVDEVVYEVWVRDIVQLAKELFSDPIFKTAPVFISSSRKTNTKNGCEMNFGLETGFRKPRFALFFRSLFIFFFIFSIFLFLFLFFGLTLGFCWA